MFHLQLIFGDLGGKKRNFYPFSESAEKKISLFFPDKSISFNSSFSLLKVAFTN